MKKLRITVEGKAYDVTVEVLDSSAPAPIVSQTAQVSAPISAPTPSAAPAPAPTAAAGAGDVVSPMAGSVLKVEVQNGAAVNEGDLLVQLEAMKMETPIFAPFGGTVSNISVSAGDSVQEGQVLVTIS
ncbi:MAG: biotin/lipoyl-binding protein [Fibrobacter sp.]|nr:biotin/lipoyl-binding protein [Fibrobacter sp.]